MGRTAGITSSCARSPTLTSDAAGSWSIRASWWSSRARQTSALTWPERSEWIDIAIRKGQIERDPIWTESVAVGSEKYLRSFQVELGDKIGAAEIVRGGIADDSIVLRRTRRNPIFVFGAKNADLRP